MEQLKMFLGYIHSAHRPSQAPHGQALVEFALVLSLLAAIIFGVVDLGRLFYSVITITNAARQGARYATLNLELWNGINATELSAIQTAAVFEAQSSGITIPPGNVSAICVDPANTPIPCTSGQILRVTVNYNVSMLIGSLFNYSSINLRKSIDMVIP